MPDLSQDRLAFWDERSGLGLSAGSGDTNLKLLEMKAINASLGSSQFVLDAGCGNAHTLVQLSKQQPDVRLFGFDYSSGMVNAARQLINDNNLAARISVCQGNLRELPLEGLLELGAPANGFDCIYTERSLINLDSLEDQISSILCLWNIVASGGRLVLCEAFLEGLNEINTFRKSVDLPDILPPWHNRYLSLAELRDALADSLGSWQIKEFSGTYYFVSRVMNARAASLEGLEPSYDSAMNVQSLDIDPLPVCGQSKILVFRKP